MQLTAMKSFLCLASCAIALALSGCAYYVAPDGTLVPAGYYYYPATATPASFDRSFAAAAGAMRDEGLTVTVEDRAAAKTLWTMRPVSTAVRRAAKSMSPLDEIDLGRLPVQTCWPDDAGPLITWGLVVTRGPQGAPAPRPRQNLGIYRQQVIGRARSIMRWLAHRGGALDFRDFALAKPGRPFPIAVALGADPATMLGAVTPVPDTLSEYQFAGLLRGSRTEVADCGVGDAGVMLQVPAQRRDRARGPHPAGAAGLHRARASTASR